jgi:hypothetical protein
MSNLISKLFEKKMKQYLTTDKNIVLSFVTQQSTKPTYPGMSILKTQLSLFLFFVLCNSSFTQTTKSDSILISDYLYSQLEYAQTRLSGNMLDSISTAELYCTKMKFPTGHGGYIPTEYHLIKTNGKFTSVYDDYELICTPEFMASLKPNFFLKDGKSALKFQELLDVVNSQNNMNSDRISFNIGQDWYFIRDVFFSKYDLFFVKTNKRGKILSIEYQRDREGLDIPENVINSDGHSVDWGYNLPKVTREDSTYLRNYFNENTNFHFEIKEQKSRLAEKITTASFYNASIVFTDGNSSSATVFKVMKTNDGVMHANSAKELLKSPQFFESLRKDFLLKTEDDAITFEEALDVIAPLGTFDIDDKEHLQIDGKWYFVRSESFGDKAAFIVEVDEKGELTNFKYDSKAIPSK